MTNQIEPYSMIQKTNIKEHNDMVNKINEIVDVINNTNLDTVNAEISALKTKATETDTEIANIKNKDTTQDTEINGITKSLVSNVTATFDNPSRELKISLGREASPSIDATVVIPASSETGQYSAGNGITIDNYQIAVDTGVVALKSDIPVVPDVSEITNRLDTIDGEITGINTDITNLTNKNTEQDTAINGKVAISQGSENAGKVLGIGADGNVTPVDAGGSSGGEVWEEVDLNNWPTDWIAGDVIRIAHKKGFSSNQPVGTTWTSSLTVSPTIVDAGRSTNIITTHIIGNNSEDGVPLLIDYRESMIIVMFLTIAGLGNLNSASASKFVYSVYIFNGASIKGNASSFTNASDCFHKVWRLKKSS